MVAGDTSSGSASKTNAKPLRCTRKPDPPPPRAALPPARSERASLKAQIPGRDRPGVQKTDGWHVDYMGGLLGRNGERDGVLEAQIRQAKFRPVGHHHEGERDFVRISFAKESTVLEQLTHGAGAGSHLYLD